MRRTLEGFGQPPTPVIGLDTTLLIGPGLRYQEHRPRANARALVAALWQSEVGDDDVRLRLVPDGCVEISRSGEGHLVVFGPSTRWSEIVLPAGESFIGCRLRAGAARALLGVPAIELRDRSLDGSTFPALRRLDARSAGWHAAILRWAELSGAGLDPSVASATTMLGAGAEVRAVASTIGVSPRELRRRFASDVGLPPVAYRRIARARRALADIALDSAGTLAGVAADSGFADHAHLSREIAAITGLRPSALTGGAAFADRP